ncbi:MULTISPECIES: aromatic ring-hydroxylating dioxygenase subunit alpha [unclassified Beijerinckia]|uniref:aromatic ring-hydroxylating dioxygenase subunit alpha n=1 Tax=unclassified Beijerinckia TaxID=2638183 RepID=UPI00089B25F2|nr:MULTISPECIES: aromatic ring-hydroxylating dioxygenase subunit alpha [unclassified Beijerinckia]MDH7796892.1 phenylpropionate dioxygenase-like ring-hydroxylating dioxygenase large terminal subunit [Beijerinckia sp. GAS462]SEC64076.1 vanillate O-demethylase monooxygenase subunit [Beijerinckia sp. 28-YEA-48]
MARSYYLRNHWYIVAHDFELSDGKPLARKVCDKPVVIFRGEDGQVGMLDDRCPHRFAPLSAGEVAGNDVQCGYHGIRFDRRGRCTHIPGNLPIPKNFAAESYPTVERHGFIWAWLGEREADETIIPDFSENKREGWKGVPGYLRIEGNYQLMVDNILDLTHVDYVHKTTLASGDVAETPLEVKVEGDRVFAQRLMFNINTANIYRAARNLNGRVDRWQLFEWLPPAYLRVILGAREAGSDMPVGDPVHIVLNGFTPESENVAHYFWSTARSWKTDDPKVDSLYETMIVQAFTEDKVIIEKQQKLIDIDPARATLVNLPFDRGAQQARRVLKRLLDEEEAGRRAAAE